ncbi:MAG: transcription termination/antitermination factor NusG [Planctomycetia bacterium]|nr:transcription termination/antitermination factor NusG [Planctomycetia bacterium]
MTDQPVAPDTLTAEPEAPPVPVEAAQADTPAADAPAPEAPAPEPAAAPEASGDETVVETPAEPKAEKAKKAKKKAADEPAPAVEAPPTPAGDGAAVTDVPASNKHWYVVKVQSGREESIKDAVERRVKIEGLEEHFGQIVIPVEKVVEVRHTKEGKTQRVTRSRKLYPGYLMVEVEFNDRILYLFRETSGVGDFVGGGQNKPPVPMSAREVDKMLHKAPDEKPTEKKPIFEMGDRVKVMKGPFAGMEGEIKEILTAKDKVRVELTIFGRPVPVELEFWDVERA